MSENRNTYVVKEMLQHIEDLKLELSDLESERRGNYVKPQFLIDDDDERTNRNILIKLLAPMVGFGMAIFTHAFHNTFGGLIGGLEGLAAGTIVDWIGWTIMLIFIIWMSFTSGTS